MQQSRPVLHVATMEGRPLQKGEQSAGFPPQFPIPVARKAIVEAAEHAGFEVRFADEVVPEPIDMTMAMRLSSASSADAILALSFEDEGWVPTKSEGGYDQRSAGWLEVDTGVVSHTPVRAVIVPQPARGMPEPGTTRYREALREASRGHVIVNDLGELSDAIFKVVLELREDIGGEHNVAQEPAQHAAAEEAIESEVEEPLQEQATDRGGFRPQPFANDLPGGPDLLGIEGEVQALAEGIALKDAQPPLVVGILGGWGWGKSFVLHLLEERLRDIRTWRLGEAGGVGAGDADNAFPYVGHLYTVRFDAWTYAKSNLWASLMRTVLVELDTQVSLERTIADKFDKDLREDTELWRTLIAMDREARRLFLSDTLAPEAAADAVDEQSLWAGLEQLRREETRLLEEAEQELASRRAKLETAQAEEEDSVRAEFLERERWEAFEPVWERVRALFGTEAEKVVAAAREASGVEPPTLEELEKKRSTLDRLLAGASRESVGLAAMALLVFVVPFFLGLEATQKVATSLVSLLTIALSGFAWVRARADEVKALADDYHGRLDALREQRSEAEDRAVEAARAKAEEDAADELQKLEDEVRRHKNRVGLPAKGRSLVDLLRERIEGRGYDRQLGLLHQVQEDLAELTEALLPRRRTEEHEDLFPRGEPRVVLVIDDLDRCPPRRVVEVLEAVQLLVRTRLFVVVIAMDVRYVTRALEKVYEGILVRDGAPSGLDYIEKIVQVPYRVRPISPAALRKFLGEHMDVAEEAPVPVVQPEPEPSAEEAPPAPKRQKMMITRTAPVPAEAIDMLIDTEPGVTEEDLDEEPVLVPLDPLPTEALQFLPDELDALRDACADAQVSPRSAKRLVNVFKLVKIVWHRREHSAPPSGTKRAMALLLALAARYPVVLRELLPALEEEFALREINGGADRIENLADFLIDECKKGLTRLESDSTLEDEWTRCQAILERSTCLPDSLALATFGGENARLVSSFSFVSDPLWERQAELEEAPVVSES